MNYLAEEPTRKVTRLDWEDPAGEFLYLDNDFLMVHRAEHEPTGEKKALHVSVGDITAEDWVPADGARRVDLDS